MPRGCKATNGWRKRRVKDQWKAAQKSRASTNAGKKTKAVMTFGKHKGQPISTLPTDYLIWACDTITDKPSLTREMRRVLDKRM